MTAPGVAGEGAPAQAAPTQAAPSSLWLWRHPRPEGAAGRCIGQTDLPVHPRRAKRLAHRIRTAARRHGLPRAVWTSPLRRCADVGRWLARWGWRHHIDARLMELHFGAWDGQPWRDIAWSEVQAWEADFTGHAPGGGEALAAMALRVAAWVQAPAPGRPPEAPGAHGGGALAATEPRLVVAHAGVMQLLQRAERPTDPAVRLATRLCAGLDAAHWPRPPRYGECRQARFGPA
ncbi:histidine phosphatase family protein [Aquabacterium sp. OR-4]|uniref:histidine phosphatase family protein n=1 Tax=Aquabacterium sp. OR-4 TaxID=2978127 RepID=UPI0028C7E5F7|nr:histidine phosphatase family protein [Aquabacterium sp. OR-4]MDT7836115.1 histidine phosphatase family protein [Aquabacterium sp. OR-4]